MYDPDWGGGKGVSLTPLFVSSSYGGVVCITVVVVLMGDQVLGVLEEGVAGEL